MIKFKKLIIIYLLFVFILNANLAWGITNSKYPDYSSLYVGEDKYEHYNRKMFRFNLRLNKYFIKPIHILWTSILPKGCIDHIQMAYNNIEYPKRLVSTIVQKDYVHSKSETKRFFINLTLGVGGLFDPAEKKFNIKGVNEDMEQALAVRHVKSGHYLIIPVATPTNTRNITGSILDTALNPTTYLFFSGYIITAIKAGILVNRTSRYQPIAQMLESNYADSYDMTKKLYGLEKHILIKNYDRSEVIQEIQNKTPHENGIVNVSYQRNFVEPDINLVNYFPAGPVSDSMRTALFRDKNAFKSIWSDTSVWNKSFNKKIKTGKILLNKNRAAYKYKYILQKKKNSPLVILYPSIGEGISSSHSVNFGKMFYDKGYSVLIMGSHFQWEFMASMPETYRPGIPTEDVKYVREATESIIKKLEKKYNKNFSNNVVLGTSLGALMTLELANAENDTNTLNIDKYIAICPPLDLIYAMNSIDKNSEEWIKFDSDLKNQVAVTASKVASVLTGQDYSLENLAKLKITEDESKLITGYIMHQKLSDLVYTIENNKNVEPKNLYTEINNMNYKDYMNKYLIANSKDTAEEQYKKSSLFYISDYLKNKDNFVIYHSVDDYLSNPKDLLRMKNLLGSKMILMSNGAHLGFLYRPEFQEMLIKEIPDVNKN